MKIINEILFEESSFVVGDLVEIILKSGNSIDCYITKIKDNEILVEELLTQKLISISLFDIFAVL